MKSLLRGMRQVHCINIFIKFLKTNTKSDSSVSGSNHSGKLGKANSPADNWVKL